MKPRQVCSRLVEAKTSLLKGNSPKKKLDNPSWRLLPTALRTDGTPRGEDREKVAQTVVQDFLMNGPRRWQVVLFEKKARDFDSSLT